MLKSKTFLRYLYYAVLISIVLVGLLYIPIVGDFLKGIENKTLDSRFKWREVPKRNSEIVIVGIDDISEKILGRFPWSREKHALFFQALANHPPKAIGLDILFTEPERSNLKNDKNLYKMSNLLDDVCWGVYYRTQKEIPDYYLDLDSVHISSLFSLALKTKGKDRGVPTAIQVHLPSMGVPIGHTLGAVNCTKDDDGIVRKLPLIYKYNNDYYPSFALALLMGYLDIHPTEVQVWFGKRIVLNSHTRGIIKIPINVKGECYVNFRRNLKDFYNDNFVNILKGYSLELKDPPVESDVLKSLENKLVVLGLSVTGSSDIDPNPLSNESPLLIVHANMVANVLENDFLKKISWSDSLVIRIGISLGLTMLFLIIPGWYAAIFLIFLIAGYLWGTWYLFNLYNIWMDWIIPFVMAFFTYIGAYTFKFIYEEKSKRWVQKAFGSYISKNVMDWILKHPESLKLGGQRRSLTVLFADIHGFTTFCERHKPEEVVPILNEYLDRMTNIVLKYNGTLDKYVGDEIIAIFGAPGEMTDKDHAWFATQAAIEMIEETRKVKEIKLAQNQEALELGIGINTGDMIVGNMGSKTIMSYTVIGDAVNLGARIEKLTRQYEVPILITEKTFHLVQDKIKANFIDEVQVKGKQDKIKIFSIVV